MLNILMRWYLLRWYKRYGRTSYPWRLTNNPYHILIAEVFLQRTKADQVLPVYNQFIKAFPSITDLAIADESEVLRIITPLGLHWRGKYLKKMGIEIRDRFGGFIPETRDELLGIAGIGEYVADSVRYLAYNQRSSIVDSNIVRILGRIYGIRTNAESRRDKRFRKLADGLLPRRKYRLFNLSLLDLGALICTREPVCARCPISRFCYYNKKHLNMYNQSEKYR